MVLGLWDPRRRGPCAVCRCRRPRRTPTPAAHRPAPGWASGRPRRCATSTPPRTRTSSPAPRPLASSGGPGARCAHDRPVLDRPLGPRHRPARRGAAGPLRRPHPRRRLRAGTAGGRISRPGDIVVLGIDVLGRAVGDRCAGARRRCVATCSTRSRGGRWSTVSGRRQRRHRRRPDRAAAPRARELLGPDGRVVAELAPPGTARARLGRARAGTTTRRRSAGRSWRRRHRRVAVTAGLLVGDVAWPGERWCAVLEAAWRIPTRPTSGPVCAAPRSPPAWVSGSASASASASLTGLVSHYAQNAAHPVPFPDQPGLGLPGDAGPPRRHRHRRRTAVAREAVDGLPRLFRRPERVAEPAARRPERGSVLVPVASAVFMLASGLANSAQWYPWSFSPRTTHYAVADRDRPGRAARAVKLPVVRGALGLDVDDAALDRPATEPGPDPSRASCGRRGWRPGGGGGDRGHRRAPLRRVSVLGSGSVAGRRASWSTRARSPRA